MNDLISLLAEVRGMRVRSAGVGSDLYTVFRGRRFLAGVVFAGVDLDAGERWEVFGGDLPRRIGGSLEDLLDMLSRIP